MRTILLAPNAVAKTAALGTSKREERWMLAQPREVRRSYVEAVLDQPEDPHAQERWMLLQTDVVRLSYLKNVVSHDRTAPPERAWMLKQSRPVRTSYVREVLDA